MELESGLNLQTETPLFECRPLLNKENIFEGLGPLLFNKKRKLFIFITFPFVAVLMGVAFFLSDSQSAFAVLTVIFILASFVAPITVFIARVNAAKTAHASMLDQNNNIETTLEIRFFDEQFIAVNTLNRNTANFSYSGITRVEVTKNLIAIKLKASFVLCEKAKFSIGDSEGLVKFLKEKKGVR